MAEVCAKLFREARDLADSGKREEAVATYSRLIDLASGHLGDLPGDTDNSLVQKLALALNNRGHLRYLMVDFPAAVEDYTKALGHDDTLAFTFYNRGLIHYRLGWFELAIRDMEAALKRDPSFEPAKKCMFQALADKKE